MDHSISEAELSEAAKFSVSYENGRKSGNNVD